MSNANLTSLTAILKPHFPYGLAATGYEENTLFALVKKKDGFGGDSIKVPIRYGHQTGRSATFTNAKANKGANKQVRFSITRDRDYAIGGIEVEALRAAMGDKNAVAEGLKEEIKGLTYALTRSIASDLFGNGGGAKGVVSSGQGSNIIQLATADDIVHWEVGMHVDGSADDGTSGAAIVGGANAVITAVDRKAGTITNSGANWNAATAINGLQAGWYLFPNGDFAQKFKGLDAWLPETAPTPGDNFFGVDRSVDPTRLAGLRIDPAATIEETLQAAMGYTYREGGRIDTIIMHPMDLQVLTITLGSKVMHVDVKTSDVPNIGFKGVQIIGQNTVAKVLSDVNCPRGVAYGLQLDTWCLHHLGDLVGVQNDDGLKMLRDADSDSVELRMVSYLQLACSSPGKNARIALP